MEAGTAVISLITVAIAVVLWYFTLRKLRFPPWIEWLFWIVIALHVADLVIRWSISSVISIVILLVGVVGLRVLYAAYRKEDEKNANAEEDADQSQA